MKLYSNTLRAVKVEQAFAAARSQDGQDIHLDGGARNFRARQVTTYDWTAQSGPRRRTQRFTNGVQFYALSYHGNRATGHRMIGSYETSYEERAASWDAYGYVIARLFLMDHDAVIGNYAGVADFVRQCENSHRREPTDFLDLVSERCDECGARIPVSETAMVNDFHDESCSLHTANVVEVQS